MEKYILLVIILILCAVSGYVLHTKRLQPFKTTMTTKTGTIRYFALGDSYTIGEGLPAKDNFPSQLTERLQKDGVSIVLIGNPSRTGWTTQDLITQELPVFDTAHADVVTLLIGVNDWVQGVDTQTFSKNLDTIFTHLQSQLTIKENIVVVTIPDFAITPTGKNYTNGRDGSAGIAEFNAIITQKAAARNLSVVDIFGLSQAMKNNSDLMNTDGLHPSKKEYTRWVDLIYPIMKIKVSAL